MISAGMVWAGGHCTECEKKHKAETYTEPAPDLKCNCFTFDGRESYDPNKQKISYLWDFGDGTTSEEAVVKHCYEKGGMYVATLTVKDDSGLNCDTAITKQNVKVNTPPVADFSAPEKNCAGSEIVFDGSASKDDSRNLSYAWDFGDGTKGEGQRVSKTYEKDGRYTVKLTVNDNENSSCSIDSIAKAISINAPLEASVAKKEIEICVPAKQDLRVVLDGRASKGGDNVTYAWDFGDGTTGEGKSAAHIYPKAGTYMARLTVNDGESTACSISSDTANVKLYRAPVAMIAPSNVCCIGEKAIFDGSGSQSDGGKLTYAWDFGDGSTGEGAKVSHVYTQSGTYKVTLKVDDNSGSPCSSSIDTLKAVVNESPVAIIKVK